MQLSVAIEILSPLILNAKGVKGRDGRMGKPGPAGVKGDKVS